MFPNKPELSITLPSKTELLKMVVELTKHIATLNHFSPSGSQKIALAVDEAITNVIEHSYEYKNEDIKIQFYSSHEGFKIEIIYSGHPPVLNDKEINLNKLIREKKKGGLGVSLMKKIMDSVKYKTIGDVNYCIMTKWKNKEF